MSRRLGEYFIKSGIISHAQLETALRIQEERSGFLGRILLEQGWISEQEFCQAVSQALRVKWIRLEHVLIGDEIVGLISNSLAVTCQILPLFAHNGTLYLAMENPGDKGVIQLVEYETGLRVRPLLAPLSELREYIARYYRLDEQSPHASAPSSEIEKKVTREIGFGERKRLGDMLVDAGLITATQLQQALKAQEGQPGFLGELIVKLGWVTEQELCRTLSKIFGIETVNVKGLTISPDITAFVPDSLAVSANVFPLYVKDQTLFLAMENPLDSGVLMLLQHETGLAVKPVVVAPSQLRSLINQYYPLRRAASG